MVWAYGLGIAQITEMTHEITEMFDLKYWNSYAQVGDTAMCLLVGWLALADT